MSGYVKGRRFEYRVRDFFRKKGFVVIRAAQSKPIDLVCLRRGETIFVECKTEKSGLGRRKRRELLSLAEAAGAVPLLSVRKKRKLIFKNLRTGKIIQIKSAYRVRSEEEWSPEVIIECKAIGEYVASPTY